ncbi:hypothetical protein GIB67_016218, partial [Kingdonia uniflora]
QVTPGEGFEVVKDLMVDDDVEVGRKVNFKAISSEYGRNHLEWKKGNENDNDDKKDVEEKVKSEEDDTKPPTAVVYYNRKKDVQHANEEEVVGKAYQASADQIIVVSVEE